VVVGVRVCSRVGVMVAVVVGAGPLTWPVPRRMRKINPAPMARVIRINPMAKGRLRVTSGKCPPWSGLLAAAGAALPVNVRPHTRQRVAVSLILVPQVGHTLVDVIGSGLIFYFAMNCFILEKSDYYIIGIRMELLIV
jgi:hypothetical protein